MSLLTVFFIFWLLSAACVFLAFNIMFYLDGEALSFTKKENLVCDLTCLLLSAIMPFGIYTLFRANKYTTGSYFKYQKTKQKWR